MSLEITSGAKVGEVSSLDCFQILKTVQSAQLIDVRTASEWYFIGVPDLASINKKIIFISWELFPEMKRNNNFKNEIIKSNFKKDDPLYFLCRSGNRSLRAAKYLASLDYKKCFNIYDGFEGDKDSKKHRSKLNGWKFNELPWIQ